MAPAAMPTTAPAMAPCDIDRAMSWPDAVDGAMFDSFCGEEDDHKSAPFSSVQLCSALFSSVKHWIEGLADGRQATGE